MKLNTKHTLDRQMVERYSSLVEAHPGSDLVIRTPDYPDFDEGVPPFEMVLQGKLTHIMWKKGVMLLVTWENSSRFKPLFDQYGTTNDTQTS